MKDHSGGRRILRLLCLDFDGVILETVGVKTRAYAALFAGEPAALPAILAYHREHLEQSRFVKFRHIYGEILRRPLAPEQERELAARFAALARDGVRTAPYVPGARELLETVRGRVPIVVVSGTPEAELRGVIRERGLDDCFTAIYGTPPAKEERLPTIPAAHGVASEASLMVGDAPGDWRAARAAGMPFIGRRGPDEPHEFPGDGTLTVVNDLHGLRDWFASHIEFPSNYSGPRRANPHPFPSPRRGEG